MSSMVQNSKNEVNKVYRILRIVSWVLFGCYLLVLGYLLYFDPRFRYTGEYSPVNLIPFHEIRRYLHWHHFASVVNILGNIAAFVPMGFFLPLLTRRRLPIPAYLGLNVGIPVLVEITQLLTKVGICDVDDVILNFLGGSIGMGLCYAVHSIVVSKKKD